MNKQNRKHYFALTFLISTLIFSIQFIITSITASIIYMLVHFQMITLDTDIRPNIGMIILYMIVISNIVGVIVAYFSSKISARPLQNVIYQIDRLASGDFSARLDFGWPISKHPVFSQLSHSFNRMASELKNTEMLRGDFVNNFSHEFKTPIVSIAGFAKLLRRGNLTEEQKEEYLAVIEEESLRLSDMATNVLNLTRVENQTILTDIVKFNLSEQIRSSILLLADKWEKKQLDFKVDFGEYRISANEELLKQVWINLLDNAIKFSPNGGVIEVNIRNQSDSLSVHIINSGEEIPAESISRIFQKFYQADSSHSGEGNGVGLAIVKKVVELHNGTVSAQSENNLTMFTVTLPKSQPNAKA